MKKQIDNPRILMVTSEVTFLRHGMRPGARVISARASGLGDVCTAHIEALYDHAPGVCLYFCMEDDRVWESCLGFLPKDRGGLARMLDASARSHCGLR